MTGKAPPTGPRALRGSIPPGSTPSTPLMSTPGASTSTTPSTLSGPRSMATPPTGPRSLINGAHPRSQPPSGTVFPQGKHTAIMNGHVPQTSSSGSIAINARLPPSGPKGKGVDTSWAGSARRPPTGPSALSGRSSLSVSPTVPNLPLRVSRQVSPVASTSSPSPKLPPPPPPSEGPPPPPPPPSSPPPPPPPEIPHLISPIKLPTNQPQEPRLAPPPLPSDPAPPSSAPPPLPPPPSIPTSGPSLIIESRQPFSIQLPPKPTTRLKSPSPPPPPPPPQRTPSPVLAPYVSVTYVTENGKQVKQYSLKKPPAWPPPRSEYPDGTDFRVLFDPSVDKDRNGTLKKLFDNVRAAAARDTKLTQRIVDKGKGREILYRFAGETIPGELVPVPADPRKAPGFRRAFKGRNEFHLPTYEYDSNSTGPPPPTTVLILNLPTLVPNNQIRRYFSQYGSISSFDHEIDRATGAALGIVSIQFSSHEEAKACVEKEDGKKFGSGSVTLGFVGMASRATESDAMRVVLDGEGKKLKAVLAELDDRKRKEREEKLRIQKENEVAAQAVPSPVPHAKPPGAPGSWRNHTTHNPPGKQSLPHRPPPNAGLPSKPLPPPASLPNQNGPQNARAAHAQGQGQNQGPPSPTRPRKQPSWVAAGRHSRAIPMAERFQDSSLLPPEAKLGGHSPGSSSSTPLYVHGARRGGFAHRRPFPMPHGHGARRDSRSPSPDVRVPGVRPGHRDSQHHYRTDDEHKAVLKELALNGRDHVHVRESEVAGGHVTPEDLKERFKMFQCDRILHDYRGWFVTFTTSDAAKRAEKVYSLSSCHLANRPVQIRAFPAPKLEDITPDGKGKLGSGASESEQRVWSKQDLIREAEKLTMRELETILEKDIMDRVVGVEVRRLVAEESRDRIYVPDAQVKGDGGVGVQKQEKLKGLKSLSFRKRKQYQEKTKENVILKPVAQSDTEDEGRQEQEQEQGHEEVVEPEVEVDDYGREKLGKPFEVEVGVKERPRKRAKSEVSSAGPSDVESEDEDEPEMVIEMSTTEIREPVGVPTIDTSEPLGARDVSANKRSPSPPLEDDARASKRQRVSQDEGPELPVTDDILTSAPSEPLPVQPIQKPEPMSVPELVTAPVQEKRSSKKAEKKKPTARKEKAKAKAKVVAPEEEIFIPPVPMDVDVVPVAEVHVIPPSSELPTPSSPSLGRVRSPVLEKTTLSLPQPPSRIQQLPESELQELCEDDEDLYFAKLAMTLNVDENFTLADPSVGDSAESHVESSSQAQSSSSPPLRKHVTGSARTEGYYKISHAEKSAYVAQYAVKQNVAETVEKPEATQKQAIASSRSNRANARRRAQGLEEMNQVQLAVALSKGQSGATEVVKFNQLQTRKKHLRFGRSPIHDWGLYAMERILKGEMVIEYVGEVIRAAVADKREKQYERQGIGSSYLFRINEDLVVDATKKGNLGRLINHSCDPNCTAKIITINGEKKIVIYAKQDIELGDEITYDYHFPIEQDKIPCLCGSLKCRGFLN